MGGRGWGGFQISFPNKYEAVGKIGGVVFVFSKRGVSLTFILTNPFQCYLSLSVWCVWVCVCVCVCVLCVSKDDPSLITSNQQIYDFYK